jgi:hypothetical protein
MLPIWAAVIRVLIFTNDGISGGDPVRSARWQEPH